MKSPLWIPLSLGINKIVGAWFYHNETDFWAIPFEQDSVRSFFDEEGNSLRKAFLKAPLRFSRISSGFSNSRYPSCTKNQATTSRSGLCGPLGDSGSYGGGRGRNPGRAIRAVEVGIM